MYNKEHRDDKYINTLQSFLEDIYGLDIKSITEAKRGFYGETWKVSTDKETYFIKIDYCVIHQKKYIDSFSIIEHINQSGIDYINKIVKTKSGELYTFFGEGVLCVFGFINGENREDYPLKDLFNHLAPIYKISTSGIEIESEDFSSYHKDTFYKRCDILKQHAQRSSIKRLFKWLDSKKMTFDYRAKRFEKFIDLCKEDKSNFYITHGDAGGNVIIGEENKFSIIDWDYPLLSPIERDTWYFICDPSNITMVNETLKEHGIDYTINEDRLAYYCYMMFFNYISEYMQCFIDFIDDEETLNILVDDVSAYFEGWITNQLRYADENYRVED